MSSDDQFLAVVAPEYADAALNALHLTARGEEAQMIGEVREQPQPPCLKPRVTEDVFIGPGHVSTVIGCRPYEWIAKDEHKPHRGFRFRAAGHAEIDRHCDYIPRIQEVQASIYHIIRETLEVLDRVQASSCSARHAARTPRRCGISWSSGDVTSWNITSRPTQQLAAVCAN